ncbi:MAG: PEGA domain-containing protein [Bacteroidales bacterium]|nr:PEGA domain-containing protein [Bacteroidales bacterium]
MKTAKILAIITTSLAIVVIAAFFIIGFFKPKPGGLIIDTVPISNIYINGNFVGKTPYKGTSVAGQVNLKLVPDENNQNLIAYETKINLQSGIQTVVRREFGSSEETSSGDVISFDKISGKLPGVVVVSSPDNAQVFIDGRSQGYSPFNTGSISAGPHKVTVKADGYTERTMDIKTQSGYRLTIYVKLSKSQETQNTISAEEEKTTTKSFIVVKDTPTGFLRMRTEPGTKGEEIAELKPGSKYLFLEADVDSGWYKIQYKDPVPGLPEGIVGWVSNEFADISTESASLNN